MFDPEFHCQNRQDEREAHLREQSDHSWYPVCVVSPSAVAIFLPCSGHPSNTAEITCFIKTKTIDSELLTFDDSDLC